METLCKGRRATRGAAVTGKVALDAAAVMAMKAHGESVILVREMTDPNDFEAMVAADGILTAKGGVLCHAAITARELGKPCIIGAGFSIDLESRAVKMGPHLVREGDTITLGEGGEVYGG